jgi:hypothetical protein
VRKPATGAVTVTVGHGHGIFIRNKNQSLFILAMSNLSEEKASVSLIPFTPTLNSHERA